MTQAQRIVLVVYFLLVAYCCIWVPWVYSVPGTAINNAKDGYAFIWDGPPSGIGIPNLVAILVRIMAVTALSAAAFVVAGMRFSWHYLSDESQMRSRTTP